MSEQAIDSKQLLLVAESVSNEKGVELEIVFEAIQAALESATRKRAGLPGGVRVEMNRTTGGFKTFRYWEVVAEEEIEFPEYQLTHTEAKERDPEIAEDGRIEEPMDSVDFGRIAARTAMQVIINKVREAERNVIVNEYESRVGELITAVVKKTTRDSVILDLGGHTEGCLPRSELMPNEAYRPGDKVRAYLYLVESQPRGPQLFFSRTRPELVTELFRIEVPEIGEDVIQVKSAARDPGARAKIAVKTNDGRIDPIGACVGMRGSRVQAVSGELNGERIDIVLWDPTPAQFVINAMSPAEVASIVVDEDRHVMDLAVKEEFLSQAIGRNGQNIRLASELTGWTLNVMSEKDFAEKNDAESQGLVEKFIEQLDIEQDVAEVLVEVGFSSVEEIAFVPDEEISDIEGLDEELIDELRRRANDVMLTRALMGEEQLTENEPAEDLLNMEGMDRHLAFQLASRGIVTMEDLAEQAIDEIADIEGLDEERAGQLIMKAREPWFA